MASEARSVPEELASCCDDSASARLRISAAAAVTAWMLSAVHSIKTKARYQVIGLITVA
jgi:hypothetical protein